LPANTPTIAEMLSQYNYSTHMIGKWHLGSYSWAQTPTGRGFESHVGYLQGYVDYYHKNISGAYDFFYNQTVYEAANGSYSMNQYMTEYERVINNFVENQQEDDRLFLYMAHQVVHEPLQLPDNDNYVQRCEGVTDPMRYIYCAMMSELDDAIAAQVALLQSTGLWDNTMLIVTTDNGGMCNYSSSVAFTSVGVNYPLRAGKFTLFEGGVHGLAFVNGGDNVFPDQLRGTNNSGLWHAVDWFSTIAHWAGIPNNALPAGVRQDSYNMWPALLQAAAPQPHTKQTTNVARRSEIPLNIFMRGEQFSAIRVGQFKLIAGHPGLYDGWYPIPPAPYQPPPAHQGHFYLFNIENDPYERNDLSHARPGIVSKLRQRLESYLPGFVPPQNNTVVCPPTNGVWLPCE